MDTNWVKARLKALRKTQDDLADSINKSRWVAGRILSGKQPLHIDQVQPFAQTLEVSELEILFRAGMWNGSQVQIVAAPLLNSVEAGTFADTTPDHPPSAAQSILVEHRSPTVLALRVSGDSMNRVAPPGSLIVIDYSQKDIKDGDLCVVRREGEATFKRFRKDADAQWLEPDSTNPRHGSIFPQENEAIEVIGLVVDIRPEYEFTKAKGAAA